MDINRSKPRRFDAVLGGKQTKNLRRDAVLGGIEGLKTRLSSIYREVKIVAIQDAIHYGEAGKDLLLSLLPNATEDLLWIIFNVLWIMTDEYQKKDLIKYLPKLLKEDVTMWNIWRKNNPEVNIDLSISNFTNTNLNGANLSWSNLIAVNLNSANLSWANISWTNLSESVLAEANFENANLMNADLRNTDLRKANFINANLSGANLQGAYLDGIDLRYANLIETTFDEKNNDYYEVAIE